jgi:hypothetical protein
MRNRLEMVARMQESEARSGMVFATTECFACGDLCYLQDCRFGTIKAQDNPAVATQVYMHPRCWEEYLGGRTYFLAEDLQPSIDFPSTPNAVSSQSFYRLASLERLDKAQRRYDRMVEATQKAWERVESAEAEAERHAKAGRH